MRDSRRSSSSAVTSQQQSCCYVSLETIWASLFFIKDEESQPQQRINSREEEKAQKVRDACFHQDVFELSQTKKNCQQIQSKFERRFDENDYSQRYEKYGSRAHFIRDRQTAFATGYVRQ